MNSAASHTSSVSRIILGSAVNDELTGTNPCRIVGAGGANPR
jgi:hypothetical protein